MQLVRCSVRFCSTGIRVRFAPSPTGNLHLGGLRTALYNYLFARANNGKFILRVEDTDQKRVVHESVEQIESVLKRYGLTYDEGPSCGGKYAPYVQSQRQNKYSNAAENLLRSGHAYRCFCSKTRMEMLRREAARRHEIPKYDNHCRHLSEKQIGEKMANGLPFTVRFKLSQEEVNYDDENYGQLKHKSDEGDFVVLKSDNFPTYHLANVLDDHEMCISHVIRGLEWLTSTPKHIQIYQAFGWSTPKWVHLPLIVRNNNKKLSKRDKDAYVDYYDLEQGYLPIAVLNYLIRNGSGIRDFDPQKLYSLNEMVEHFDAKEIGRRSIMLDQSYLDVYGCKALQSLHLEKQLIPAISERLQRTDVTSQADKSLLTDSTYVRRVLDLFDRTDQKVSNLRELTDGDFRYFFHRPSNAQGFIDSGVQHVALPVLEGMLERCEQQQFNADDLKGLAKQMKLKHSAFYTIIRLALIDSPNGPPVLELLRFFGADECTKRFSKMIGLLNEMRSSAAV